MKLQRLFLCFVFISAALIFFNQCTSADADGASIQVFRFNELGAVTSLDPALAGSFENNWALNQLYNGLVEMDTSLAVKGCIARNWNISDDGLQYVFQLRTDVFFTTAHNFLQVRVEKLRQTILYIVSIDCLTRKFRMPQPLSTELLWSKERELLL